MMLFKCAILLCSSIGMTSASAFGAREAAIAARSTAAMTYIGPTTPGGSNVTLSGTAESIHAQILILNPTFNPDDFEITRKARRDVDKRQQTGGCCRCTTMYLFEADSSAILSGADYLRSLPGSCVTDGYGIARVSCSYNSQIILANTVQAAISAPCVTLGNYASQIEGSCNLYFANLNEYRSNGQICDAGGYCTIVAGADGC